MPVTQQKSSDLNQLSYKPTEYADSTYEVVGTYEEEYHFLPLEMPVLDESIPVDGMFADYGGGGTVSEDKTRWHLPKNVAYKSEAKRKEEEKATIVKRTPLTDKEIEQIKEAAYAEGRESSLAEAATMATEKMAVLEGKMTEIFTDLEKQLNEHIVQVQKQTVQLALAISSRIVSSAVEVNPEYIEQIVAEALAHAGSAQVSKVRVSTQDLEFIDVIGVRKKIKQFDGSWEFEADPAIKAGCVVETSAGEIDFDLDKAWERIRDNVVKVIS